MTNEHLPQEYNMSAKSSPLQREREEESKKFVRAGMHLAIPWTVAISAIGWGGWTMWNKQTDNDKVVVVHEIRLKSLEDSSIVLRADITNGLNRQDAKTDKILDKIDELSRRIK